MGETTEISWTDSTANFWKGCNKVSEACANCYMFRDAGRYGWEPTTVTRCKGIWKDILNPKKFLPGNKVFVCSWSDFFHPGADEWRDEAWDTMRKRPDLIFQLLTKRPERIKECLPYEWSDGWPNVWLGTTAENQKRLDERIAHLLQVSAVVHFLSCEPLLGSIDLGSLVWVSLPQTVRGDWPFAHNVSVGPGIHCADVNPQGAVSIPLTDGGLGVKPSEIDWCRKLDWVIAGGETGPNARPSHPDWFRSLRDQCQAVGVPFHFKQWGEWVPCDSECGGPDRYSPHKPNYSAEQLVVLPEMEKYANGRPCRFVNGPGGAKIMIRVGKKAAGRLLDGKVWAEMPQGRE